MDAQISKLSWHDSEIILRTELFQISKMLFSLTLFFWRPTDSRHQQRNDFSEKPQSQCSTAFNGCWIISYIYFVSFQSSQTLYRLQKYTKKITGWKCVTGSITKKYHRERPNLHRKNVLLRITEGKKERKKLRGTFFFIFPLTHLCELSMVFSLWTTYLKSRYLQFLF